MVPDVRADPRFTQGERAAHEALDIVGAVAVPLVKAGALVAVLAVHSRAPRAWTAGEVALVTECAERTWAAVERARAETAQRADEARYRQLAEAVPQIVWESSDEATDYFNQRWYDYTGLPRGNGSGNDADNGARNGAGGNGWLAVVHPDDAPAAERSSAEAARTGRPCELAYRLRRADGAYRGHLARAVRLPETGRWIGTAVDIHDLSEAQSALRASEERFRLAAEAVNAVIYDWDVASGRVARTRGLAEVLGYDDVGTEPVLNDWLAVIHPDDRARVRAELDAAFAGRGDRYAIAYRVRHRDGTYRDFWDHGRIVRGPDGAARRVVGSSIDVTAQTRLEAALRGSEARARAIVDTLPGAAVFMFDRELRYLLAGGEAFSAAGFTPEDFVGRPLEAVLGPATADAYARRLRPALAGTPFEEEHAAHGRIFLSRGVPLRDAGGGVTAVLVASVDVTARRAAEEALRASEARYRTLVEHVRDYAIFLLDPAGVVTEWTPGAERVTGYAAEEAVGQPLALFYTPEDAGAGVPAAQLAEAAADGRGEWEGWRLRRDGSRYWATEIATAVRDADGRLAGFTKISRDLTERRLAAAAAEQAQQQAARDELRRALAQAEEAERQRLARELHDQLGQELTALRLGLDEAARLAALTDAPAAALRERLRLLAQLATRMTADVRYLALELRPPELDDLGLESALETYAAERSARYGVAAEVAVTGLRGRAVAPGVASAVYRIAQEALTNVAKHAGATQVSVLVDQPDGEVRLIVEDDGRGFDPEATAARVRAERRLGLAGMRERAALAGGTVVIESSPGDGTTVYVRLPVTAAVAPAG